MRIEPGQIWSIKNSDKIQHCKAVVLLLENIEEERIVHIALVDEFGYLVINHLPFSRAAFEDSVETLVGVASGEYSYEEGYRYWKSEYEAGRAGLFGINISECVII